jgi:PAS domain S-box-containing protein
MPLLPIITFVLGLALGLALYWVRTREFAKALSGIEDEPNTSMQKTLAARLAAMKESIHSLRLERDTLFERHDLITTNIAASVLIRDVTGKIVFCSPYTQVLTGYSLDDIYDAQDDFFLRLVVEEDKPRYQRAQQVSALAEDISVKYRILHRSGLKIWLETRLVPVCDEEGTLISTMSVSIDVTDTLSYQKQIEEQNRDLSDFAYMVSHDLKAPIFTIKGMATALLEDHEQALGKDGGELVHYMIDATKRLEKLIASVIEYSALATKDAQDEQVDLNIAVKNSVADLAELVKEKHADISVPETLPTIIGNPVRLYQVFSNLLGNALKYSSAERQPVITIEHRSGPGNTLIVEIRDNGIGVPSAKIQDIFRPYHRAHGNTIEGNGIGLACVKKIMERLGGTVSATSIEGKGSVFMLTFPSVAPKPREIPHDLARAFSQ